MNQYKIDVTYTRLDIDGNIITRVMSFVTSANSLEEARSLAQETSITYIDRVNGIFVSAE